MSITKIQKQLEAPPNHPGHVDLLRCAWTWSVGYVCRSGGPTSLPERPVATCVWKVGSACWLGVENNRLQSSKFASKVSCVALYAVAIKIS